MRSYRYLLLCLALILCLQSVVAIPQNALRRQDDSETPESSARDNASIRSSATRTQSVVSSRPSNESELPASTTQSAVKSSTTPSTSIQAPATGPTNEPDPSPSADVVSKNPLPIQPSLTPAMGLSGVLLLLTGLVYAVIGIKNKWIYIFGSAAYLTTLAVTVLIIYLMSPPVSNAIQGAFFVAAFFTGVIFGVLSLVFADITEGFGCLLGGFCLSMWFLSLRDGGLIPSTAGRAIFIGCMSAGGYSLSFSHYTRNYGLIASISFSGATATILGIDCLARAGWKEFWLYLWNLNDNVFPLDTNTYPVTKNIKAELAGVVIIAVFGVVSQMRVWKLVKEHREKSAAQQLERQLDQDREEEALGRKIEDEFHKERAQWEAAYGGKSVQESSIRSSITGPKGSTSIREKETYGSDSVEMATLPKSGVNRYDTPAGTTVTVSVLRDDDIQLIDEHGNPIPQKQNVVVGETDTTHKVLPEAPETDGNHPVLTRNASLRPSVPPPPPAVIPLPFTVPKEDDANADSDDNASVSAVPDSIHEAQSERRPMSKRISDMSVMRQRLSRDIGESQEALVTVPYMEDDRASSVAATLDDDHDDISLRRLSPPHSPLGTEHNRFSGVYDMPVTDSDVLNDTAGMAKTKAPNANKDASDEPATKELSGTPDVPATLVSTNDLKDAEDTTASKAAVQQSLTSSTDPKLEQPRQKRSSVRDSRIRTDTVISNLNGSSEGQPTQSTMSDARSQGSNIHQAESQIGSLRDGVLPERLSKVALSYRTNEWAKHLEAAERPDLDDLQAPASPGAILEEGPQETPAPVSDEIASPLIGSKRNSRRQSVESRVNRSSGIGLGLNRSASTLTQDPIIGQRPLSRSTPAVSPGVMSRSNSGTRLDALSPLPTNTLMSQRENLVKNRVSSQSLTAHSSSANLLGEQVDSENMTLAQRRQLLQHQNSSSSTLQHQTSVTSQRRTPPSTSQKWQKKSWAVSGAPSGFDSHQPKRTTSSQSDQKREQLYAGWRDNMRDVTPPQTAAYVVEQQRIALINERRQKEMEKQQREIMQQQRASQMDSMMRSGQMMDAHREAMRKMQANANKRA